MAGARDRSMIPTERRRRKVFVRPDLSVIVAAYGDPDGARRTRAVLDELSRSGAPIDYVVVGDGDGEGEVEGDAWNRAIASSRGDVIAYLDSGVIPDAAWVDSALDALCRNPGVDAVAANLVDLDTGRTLERPAGLAFTGHLLPLSLPPQSAARTMVLGRSWVARRDRLAHVGGIDPFTSMPYGLVDLAWRFWLVGKGVLFDPEFTVAGTAKPQPDRDVDQALSHEREALVTIFRNYDERNLAAAMRAVPSLTLQRLARCPGVGPGHLSSANRAFDTIKATFSPQRQLRQAARKRPDAEIVNAFGEALAPDYGSSEFADVHCGAVAAMGSDHVFAGCYRVVVVTADTLGVKMAGPGIRAVRIAERLARDHHVKLASTTSADLERKDLEVSAVDPRGLAALVEWSDIVVFQGWVFAGNPALDRSDRIFLVDVYDPMHLEQLEQAKDLEDYGRLAAVRSATAVLNEQLLRGDSFFCASGKQRDFWLGQMAALGRINPAVYDDDPSLDSLICEVPFGISDDPPVRTRAALKGVVPGIEPGDRVILWGGGVYNWFDPLTLLHAVDRLRLRRDDVRLVFLGMRHPNPDIPEMRMAVETRNLAEQLGLVGSHVFFNEEWVAYDDRQNFLLDADVAVTTHLHHVETEFSFRTRVLDYFWAGIPTVATSGDSLADLIDQRQLGLTAPPGDVDALADALFRLLDDREFHAECRANIDVVRPRFHWSNVLEPIAQRCQNPQRAPDLIAGIVHTDGSVDLAGDLLKVGLARDLKMAYLHFREQGPTVVLEKIQNRIRRQLA